MLSQDFREFAELLIKHKVEYLVVGGYAVGIYGYPRFTGDLDIWINPSPENAEKVLLCVREFGFSSYQLTASDFSKSGNVVQLGYPPLRIDLINELDGVKFEQCFPDRKTAEIDGLQLNFISYQDLVKNKKATGRAKDFLDIDNMKP
jgi:hypothetical protein